MSHVSPGSSMFFVHNDNSINHHQEQLQKKEKKESVVFTHARIVFLFRDWLITTLKKPSYPISIKLRDQIHLLYWKY